MPFESSGLPQTRFRRGQAKGASSPNRDASVTAWQRGPLRIDIDTTHRRAQRTGGMSMLKAGSVLVRLAAGIALSCALLPTSFAATGGTGPAASGAPDVVLLHGAILTMNASNSIAEAVAIKGDTIIDVGTEARIKALAGSSTRVIDLEGKTVVPGFIDPRVMGPFGFWETLGGISLTAEGGVPAGS